jgi:hypothetical protein
VGLESSSRCSKRSRCSNFEGNDEHLEDEHLEQDPSEPTSDDLTIPTFLRREGNQ